MAKVITQTTEAEPSRKPIIIEFNHQSEGGGVHNYRCMKLNETSASPIAQRIGIASHHNES